MGLVALFASPPARSIGELDRSRRSRERRASFPRLLIATLTAGRRVDRVSLLNFTRELSILVHAGLPLVRSLEIVGRQTRIPAWRLIITDVAARIRTGASFSEGLGAYPAVFDRLYVNMIKAGEAAGALDVVLGRLASFMEKTHRIRARLQAAMTYPAIVTLVATGIVWLLLVFVVPKFEDIFASLLRGQPLPAITQSLLTASLLIKNHALAGCGSIVVFAVAVNRVGRSNQGQRIGHRLVIRFPVVGRVAGRAAVARFCRTLGTLLTAGVPLLTALKVAEAVDRLHDHVKAGGTIALGLEQIPIFPPMAVSMVEVGEETGALADMLTRIADIYDEEVDRDLGSLTTLVEPILIVLMAAVVGTIVIALFLPLASILQHL
jgi:type IV pilus assembly protein PilC